MRSAPLRSYRPKQNAGGMVPYSPLVDETPLSISALLAACVDRNDTDAWEEFVSRFQRTIAGTVYKMVRSYGSASKSLVEDLIQDTFLRLCAGRCRTLREFQAVEEVKFYGVLHAVAINAVHDHFRKMRAQKRAPEENAIPIDSMARGMPEPVSGEAFYRNSLDLDRIDEVLRNLNSQDAARNRTIFWLYNRDGYSAAEISRLPGMKLSAKGVETILSRLEKEIRARMRGEGA